MGKLYRRSFKFDIYIFYVFKYKNIYKFLYVFITLFLNILIINATDLS